MQTRQVYADEEMEEGKYCETREDVSPLECDHKEVAADSAASSEDNEERILWVA